MIFRVFYNSFNLFLIIYYIVFGVIEFANKQYIIYYVINHYISVLLTIMIIIILGLTKIKLRRNVKCYKIIMFIIYVI